MRAKPASDWDYLYWGIKRKPGLEAEPTMIFNVGSRILLPKVCMDLTRECNVHLTWGHCCDPQYCFLALYGSLRTVNWPKMLQIWYKKALSIMQLQELQASKCSSDAQCASAYDGVWLMVVPLWGLSNTRQLTDQAVGNHKHKHPSNKCYDNLSWTVYIHLQYTFLSMAS